MHQSREKVKNIRYVYSGKPKALDHLFVDASEADLNEMRTAAAIFLLGWGTVGDIKR
jgi:hypothetical protein